MEKSTEMLRHSGIISFLGLVEDLMLRMQGTQS